MSTYCTRTPHMGLLGTQRLDSGLGPPPPESLLWVIADSTCFTGTRRRWPEGAHREALSSGWPGRAPAGCLVTLMLSSVCGPLPLLLGRWGRVQNPHRQCAAALLLFLFNACFSLHYSS